MAAEAIPCPVCFFRVEPALHVGAFYICGACGASMAVDNGGVRRATAVDLDALSAADLKLLRVARGKIARPGAR